MTPKTFLLIGRSGAGKGTQSHILNEYLMKEMESNPSPLPVCYVETGARFRKFINGESYTSSLAHEVYSAGGRLPDFLAIWNWTSFLIENFKENMHLIIDGAPRSLLEAELLDTAFPFYKRENPTIVYINVSSEWSKVHLLNRGRTDDKVADIENKIKWFDEQVIPAVEHFRNSPLYTFIEINGEQSIEKVQEDMMKALDL